MSNRTLTVKEVAERYGVSDRTVVLWSQNGEMRGTNCSRSLASKKPRYRISESALQEFELLRSPTPAVPQNRRKKQSADGIDRY